MIFNGSFFKSSLAGLRAATLVATLAITGLAQNAAHASDTIDVVLDQAKVLQLPPNTATIILGNPAVADVTMLRRNNQMILTGKAFGQTNMIALDADGNSIGESTLRVSGAAHGLVVQRGLSRQTYSCAPRCQPTITLGDDQVFLNQTIAQSRIRTQTARQR